MTERDLIDQLCDLRPDWTERREEIHRDHMYYVDGAGIAVEVACAVIAGKDEPWMRAACTVIERALVHGTSGTRNLVVVGLFESMQGTVYRDARDPDCMTDWLGPRSRQAWADLIEGWTGVGIRTIAAWRGVLANGPRHHVELHAPGFELVAQLAFGIWPAPQPTDPPLDAPNLVSWRYRLGNGAWIPTEDDTKRIVEPIRPLSSIRRIGAGTVDPGEVYATLFLDGAQGPVTITFGRELGSENDTGRIAHSEGQLYLVDFNALIARWTWITQRS